MTGEIDSSTNPIPFKAETRQLLDILIHSLYTERGIFLRELISNASDALTRMNFEMLTNHTVLDPDAELAIWITWDKDQKLLKITDTGIGMNASELEENLGTIAHSGARAFLEAAQANQGKISDIIGQFGVGFYSAFMVADWIRVTSRSFRPEDTAAVWISKGADTFTIEPIEKNHRGTEIEIKLNDDSLEFLEEYNLHNIITKHSNYVPFPIYLGESNTQANQQTALWRKMPKEVKEEEYKDFYRQFTLEAESPLAQAHMVVDAPYQMYALLFIPTSTEHAVFSLRKQDGLKLYARKVLIQEYTKELLPEYFRFVQGVVDSEDIPLNVSRETIQSNRVLQHLKKVLTGKITDTLKSLGQDKPDEYTRFWKNFGSFIKEGIATDTDSQEALYPLLRYHTLKAPDQWKSLSNYIQEMKPDQKKIYFITGDDERALVNSPHLEVFRHLDYDVLLMTDPLDSFVLLRLTKFQEHELASAATEEIKAPENLNKKEEVGEGSEDSVNVQALIERFKEGLGERVKDVRTTDRLVESPARLVDPEGTPNAEMQRVYRMLNRDFEVPLKILEINPKHTILKKLEQISKDDPRNQRIIDQVYENALLIEGLHPNPAEMIARIQNLMEDALKK
jgi:molecular chaperone HtpG